MSYIDKLILNGSTFKLNPGGTPTAEIDLTPYLKDWSVAPKRASVNVSAHGDLADAYGKGGGQHQLTINWFYPKALSTIMPLLLGELNKDANTPFQGSFKPGAKGIDNPYLTGLVCLHDLGKWGGGRNVAMETSVTVPCSGQCTYDDGTTPIVF